MKKYLLSLVVFLFVLSGCSFKNDTTSYIQVSVKNQKVSQENSKTSINESDFINELALHDAVRAKDIEMVKLLISEKSEINIKDDYGYTPLHLAVRFNELEIAKLLIKSGAILNSVDNYKDTPLLDSTRNKFTKMSELLICKGAYRNVSDSHNMTPLHYSSKTKDMYISNMLLSSSLEEYCQEPIQITIDDLENVRNHTPKICGEITEGIASSIELSLSNKDLKVVGPYDAVIDQKNKSWCANISDELENGVYTATALGKDKAKHSFTVKDEFNIVPNLELTIDNKDIINDSTPEICGDLKTDDFVSVEVVMTHDTGQEYGPYSSILNSKNNRWCAQINDFLKNGNYIAKALGKDKQGNETSAQDDLKIHVISTLYKDLNEEFDEDFADWNAQLDEDTLTFRFKSTQFIFEHGSDEINSNYKEVLMNFYPRYINIIKKYKSEITNVFVEGHTSSVYTTAANEEERFDLNMKLSQKRAKEVVDFIGVLKNNEISENIDWIIGIFKSVGKSSSNLIKNTDGTENQDLSRRVEFRIKTIPKEELQSADILPE